MAQKLLKQVSTGRIYPWTKILSDRPDMIDWPPVAKNMGLAEPGADGTPVLEIEYARVKYLVSQPSVNDFNKLVNEHSDLLAENERLKKELSEKPKYDPVEKTEPPLTRESVEGNQGNVAEPDPEAVETSEPDDANRMELIVAGIEELVKSGDKEHFAASGMPKVQAIQDVCGFDITAEERNDAWNTINSK